MSDCPTSPNGRHKFFRDLDRTTGKMVESKSCAICGYVKEPCPTCGGKTLVYRSNGYYGAIIDCPTCQPPAPKRPEWMQPQGQSMVHPTAKDVDGGARLV